MADPPFDADVFDNDVFDALPNTDGACIHLTELTSPTVTLVLGEC